MRLLLIGPEYQSLDKVRNFSGLWSHYLAKEFHNLGVQFEFTPAVHNLLWSERKLIDYHRSYKLDRFDHVLALGTRYFTKLPLICSSILRKKIGAGIVAQIHDKALTDGRADVTFCVRADGADGRVNVPVGWAADSHIIQSCQPIDQLRILIDHPNYGNVIDNPKRRMDWTSQVYREVQALQASSLYKPRWSGLVVRQLVDGGVSDCPPVARAYNRETVSFPLVAREYSQTHFFMVTHPETVGLSVLETALAGALPIVPHKFISNDRLKTVRHLIWNTQTEKHIDWKKALALLDIHASRELARMNNWTAIAMRIILRLEENK